MFSLAALAAVAAMAFMGASTAAASTNTLLCKNHEQPCNNPVSLIHLVSVKDAGGNYPRLLNSTANILCLEVLAEGHVLGLGNPQEVHLLSLTASGCGTNSSHNNCTFTMSASEESPTLIDVLRESLNLGKINLLKDNEGKSPTLHVECTIFGFIEIECTWDLTGLEFNMEGAGHSGGAGNGMITANKSPGSLTEGTGLCPETESLDFLLEPLEPAYIVE